jgi:hypothetical protein
MSASPSRRRLRHRVDFSLEPLDLRFQRIMIREHFALGPRRQFPIVPPPVETDLLRFVQRADEQADTNGEQLDFRERDLDVACDHQPLVEHPVEHVHKAGGAVMRRRKVESHVAANYIARVSGRQLGRPDAVSGTIDELSSFIF